MCRILPICAVLRGTVQCFAVIVPFNAVLCRAEKAASRASEPALSYCTSCTYFSFVSKEVLEVHEVQQLNETPNSALLSLH